jgi:hypothetical protein
VNAGAATTTTAAFGTTPGSSGFSGNVVVVGGGGVVVGGTSPQTIDTVSVPSCAACPFHVTYADTVPDAPSKFVNAEMSTDAVPDGVALADDTSTFDGPPFADTWNVIGRSPDENASYCADTDAHDTETFVPGFK